MRGLQLRPTGWYLRVRIPAHLRASYGGRREHVESLGTRDRDVAVTAAEAALDRLRREFAERGTRPTGYASIVAATPQSASERPGLGTLAAMIEAFRADREGTTWGPATARGYRQHLGRGLAEFGGARAPGSISRADVRTWRSKLLKEGLSPGYINGLLVSWGALYRWAHLEAEVPGITGNPFAALRLRGDRAESEERLAFSREELRRVFDEWPPAGADDGSRWVPLLVLYAGLRPQEAAQLAVDDVGEIEGDIPVVHVRAKLDGQRLKTRSAERIIPLAGELWDGWGMRVWIRGRAERASSHPAFLFPQLMANRREPAHRTSVHFTQHLRALGFADRRYYVLYSLRHTLATTLGEAGIPEHLIGEDVLGHRKATLAGNRYRKVRAVP